MKKKITKLIIFASAGAISFTGQLARAGDVQIKANSSQTKTEIRGSNSFGEIKKVSDLLGTDVRNQQDEKIGDVKDFAVDLQSGRIPYAIVSAGGFFGVGDRLLAIPTSAFAQAGDKELVINMDKQRLKSAPSFDKNNWPAMEDRAWASQVYSYYDQSPYWETTKTAETYRSSEISEPAGTQSSRTYVEKSSSPFGETTTGLNLDRTPRQGLGAEDLISNEVKINNPGGYAETDVFVQEPSGAERSKTVRTETKTTQKNWEQSTTATTQMGKVRRATDLIGMEVKNAQNEKIGEIKDIVLDLQTGRVAYALLSAGGFLGLGDKLYAVPPTLFTRGTEDRILIFNVDKETLKAAPSFDKNNWDQSNNQKFTIEVYQYYHQEPYWQGGIREPSGGQQEFKLNRGSDNGQDSQEQKDYNNEQEKKRSEIQEPSGANRQPATSRQSSTKAYSDSNASADQPSVSQSQESTEPERAQNTQQTDQSKGTAAKESAEVNASPNSTAQQAQSLDQGAQVKEPAGATTPSVSSTAPATSDDQAGSDADRELSRKVRMALKNDNSLSTIAPNVKVSAANGRITLRGSVSSEQERQSVMTKVQETAGTGADKIDNQLEVKTSNDNSNTIPNPTP